MKAGIYNRDCMKAMQEFPDNFFELAIVDPPYGVGDFVQRSGDANKWNKRVANKYGKIKWNNETPTKEYFIELRRISKNQIIWGATYYNEFDKYGGAIIWDKKCDHSRYSDADIASCSLHKKNKIFRYMWSGFVQQDMKNKEIRIHSYQKPIKLYEWILMNYAKEGDKILDTHLGSGSSAIAAHRLGFEFWGYEINKDYYEAAVKRINLEKTKLQLFQ